MGMGAGGMGTGVGSTTTQTGNQFGGKGGGRSTQPQNTTLDQARQQYRPMGGDTFGYNMNRLSTQMDPSATLPTQQTQLSMQPQGQPGYGDKGGGEFQIPADARGYMGQMINDTGPFGGGFRGYSPQFFSPMYGPNPFAPSAPAPAPSASFDTSALEDRIQQLQDQIAKMGKTTGVQDSELKDTGEETYNLGEQFNDKGVGLGANPPAKPVTDADRQAADAAAAAAAPKFTSFSSFSPDQLRALGNKGTVGSYLKTLSTTLSGDLKRANDNLNAALASGDFTKIAEARKQVGATTASIAAVKNAPKSIKYDKKGNIILPAPTPAPAPAAATSAPAPAAATPAPAATSVKAVPQAKKTRKTTLSKRAGLNMKKGGIIHNGMTSNLKKQLGVK